ncbi:hypothetical protein [Paenibacillus kobensis]|uniref:hypothetical protein n=1 Tax=Paenibacillus kobensis TaxID=59841 RepID=UPI000FD8F261|nr:hypothetical protein [Paenibacillus kobensis]
MRVYKEKHFSASALHTVRYVFVLCIIFLISCSNQESTVPESVSEEHIASSIGVADQNQRNEETSNKSQNIDALLSGEKASLTISQHDNVFIAASPSFTQRIIDALKTHDDAVTKTSEVDPYDIALRFDGYKDIFINLEWNSFWFEGADQQYPMGIAFANQWDRYSIHVVDGNITYDTFEKTILRKTPFISHDGISNTAVLFYDGDIRLDVNNSQVVIDSNVDENSLNYNDSSAPLTSYSMQTVGDYPLLAVMKNFSTVKGPNVTLDLFSYTDQDIRNVFSTSEMACELDALDLVKGKVTIGLPFANTIMTHNLTSKERSISASKMKDFKENNVEIDDEYIKSIKDTISCAPVKVAFKVANGVEEILISTNIQSVGARTPISINWNVVFKFEIKDNLVHYKEAVFDNV